MSIVRDVCTPAYALQRQDSHTSHQRLQDEEGKAEHDCSFHEDFQGGGSCWIVQRFWGDNAEHIFHACVNRFMILCHYIESPLQNTPISSSIPSCAHPTSSVLQQSSPRAPKHHSFQQLQSFSLELLQEHLRRSSPSQSLSSQLVNRSVVRSTSHGGIAISSPLTLRKVKSPLRQKLLRMMRRR